MNERLQTHLSVPKAIFPMIKTDIFENQIVIVGTCFTFFWWTTFVRISIKSTKSVDRIRVLFQPNKNGKFPTRQLTIGMPKIDLFQSNSNEFCCGRPLVELL